MIKKFIEWIYAKIIIDKKERRVNIKESEVYWCNLGENIGDEENGKGEGFKRPVLVIKKFNKNIFWGVPMSAQIKDNRYYIQITLKNVVRSVMVSQLRLLDVKRLGVKIGYISKEDFNRVKKSITDLLQ
jgi:mRNA interferase MazF